MERRKAKEACLRALNAVVCVMVLSSLFFSGIAHASTGSVTVTARVRATLQAQLIELADGTQDLVVKTNMTSVRITYVTGGRSVTVDVPQGKSVYHDVTYYSLVGS